MRWGEPLSVYDSAKTTLTTEQLDVFLKTKGYFNSTAASNIEVKGKKVRVTYRIYEGRPHVIDTFIFTTDDKNIEHIVLERQRRNFIEKGSLYDQSLLISERQRVDDLLTPQAEKGTTDEHR